MNREARMRHLAAMDELETLCNEVAKETPEVHEVQGVWLAFKKAEAARQAELNLRGTIRPMLYSMAAEEITRARISELREWLEHGLAGSF